MTELLDVLSREKFAIRLARNPHSAALIFFFRFVQFFTLPVASRGIAVPWIVAPGYPLPKS